jgi:hypothetical protein
MPRQQYTRELRIATMHELDAGKSIAYVARQYPPISDQSQTAGGVERGMACERVGLYPHGHPGQSIIFSFLIERPFSLAVLDRQSPIRSVTHAPRSGADGPSVAMREAVLSARSLEERRTPERRCGGIERRPSRKLLACHLLASYAAALQSNSKEVLP